MDAAQLTIDGREESVAVQAYVPPPPLPPKCPVVSLSIARQQLRGVKSTRDCQYLENPPGP